MAFDQTPENDGRPEPEADYLALASNAWGRTGCPYKAAGIAFDEMLRIFAGLKNKRRLSKSDREKIGALTVQVYETTGCDEVRWDDRGPYDPTAAEPAILPHVGRFRFDVETGRIIGVARVIDGRLVDLVSGDLVDPT